MAIAEGNEQGGDAPPRSEDAQFNECLKLLQGPTDEKRFVGLLLVTKLLPHGDPDSLKAVYQAVGPTFLSRLLLALHRPPSSPPLPPPALQKQVGTTALGLAILASVTQVPDIATDLGMEDQLPLFLKVVRAGGVAAALGVPADATTETDTEAASMRDALECAVAVAATAGVHGRRIALESGALAAVTDVLQRAARSSGGMGQDHQVEILALRLAALVLDVATHADKARLFHEHGSEIEALLPLLARLLAAPAALRLCPDPPESAADAAAAVQLEALSVLLLTVPVPPASLLGFTLSTSASTSPWAADILAGIATLLQSRTAAAQRHGALQLAAELVELAGAGWLAGPLHPSPSTLSTFGAKPGGASTADGQGDGSFYLLLTEMTRIEAGVLLLDALSPGVPVPNAAAAGPAAAQYAPPLPRSSTGDVPRTGTAPESSDQGGEQEGKETEDEEEGGPDLEGLRQAMKSGGSGGVLPGTIDEGSGVPRPPDPGATAERVDAIAVPTDMTWAGASEASGNRAARMLPVCFTLLEAAIDVLVSHEQEESPLSPRVTLSSPATSAQPAIPARIADRAMTSIQEAIEVVLQYLEQISEVESGGNVRPVTVAAVRAVCRFCAEAPDAFSPRMRALAPWLLHLVTTDAPSVPDTASLLIQPSPPNVEASVGTTAAVPGAHKQLVGVLFLLPTMLQVTLPEWAAEAGAPGTPTRATEQAAWFLVLRQKAALGPVVEYAKAVLHDVITAVTTGGEDEVHARAVVVCDFLLRLVAGCPGSNEEDEGVDAQEVTAVSSASGRQGLSAEAAATVMLSVTKLTQALRRLLAIGQSSFTQRQAAAKHMRPQVARATAVAAALLAQLWLLAQERRVAPAFASHVTTIHQALISALLITHGGLSTAQHAGDVDMYEELAEWDEGLLRDVASLRAVSPEFDAACGSSAMFGAAVQHWGEVGDGQLAALVRQLGELRY